MLRRPALLYFAFLALLNVTTGCGSKADNPGADGGLDGSQPQPDGSVPLEGHPRMFFSADDLPTIQSQASSTHADIAGTILDDADDRLEEAVETYPTDGSRPDLGATASALTVVAFAYVLTGEARYLDRGRELLAEVATWPAWGWDSVEGDRDLSLSGMLMGYALAYDWLHSELSESERQIAREALGLHTERMYEAATSPQTTGWGNWWHSSYAQNHWSECNAALGTGALVLEGEDARAEQWYDHAGGQYEINRYSLEHIADGSWHEGILYQNRKFVLALPFTHNLLRLKGVNPFPDEYLQSFVLWRMYNYLPDSHLTAVTAGDYVTDWNMNVNRGNILLRLAAKRFGDGSAEWLSQRILEQTNMGTWQAYLRTYEFFEYDATVTAEPPDLPGAHNFEDMHTVVWRTGFGSDDLTFALKSGPYGGEFFYQAYTQQQYPFDAEGLAVNVGHDHEDAATFYLYRGGVDLASEMADYYATWGELPDEGQTAHNTLLVDGVGQYWAPHHALFDVPDARLEAVSTTPNFSFLVADPTERYREIGDAASGYAPGDRFIEEFKRYVIFVRPDYLVMIDRVRDSAPHRYDWICHFGVGATVTQEGDWLRAAPNATDVLGLYVARPTSFAVDQGFSVYPHGGMQKPYVRVRPQTDVANTTFAMVLYPTTDAAWGSRPTITALAGDEAEGAGVEVELPGSYTHTHLVRTAASATPTDTATLGTYVLTGRAASVLRDGTGGTGGGALTALFLESGTEVADQNGARVLIQAPASTSTPVTVEASFSGTGTALAVYGDNTAGLRIYAPTVDLAQVTLNDQPVTPTRDGDYVVLP